MTAGVRRRFVTFKDAAQDRRVEYSDAEVAFEKAVATAVADRAAAMARADVRWDGACKRARNNAVSRRALRATYRGLKDEDLVDLYNRYEYILSDEYAQFRDVALEEQALMNMYMMAPIMTSRGLAV